MRTLALLITFTVLIFIALSVAARNSDLVSAPKSSHTTKSDIVHYGMMIPYMSNPYMMTYNMMNPDMATPNAMPAGIGHGHTTATTATSKPATTLKNGFDGMPAVGTPAVCPVLGTKFKVTPNTPHSQYKGKTYVFCCSSCKPTFDANPGKYVKGN